MITILNLVIIINCGSLRLVCGVSAFVLMINLRAADLRYAYSESACISD